MHKPLKTTQKLFLELDPLLYPAELTGAELAQTYTATNKSPSGALAALVREDHFESEVDAAIRVC
jgi:hypothetical protein